MARGVVNSPVGVGVMWYAVEVGEWTRGVSGFVTWYGRPKLSPAQLASTPPGVRKACATVQSLGGLPR